jgi:Protein of unknown function (DUF3300)
MKKFLMAIPAALLLLCVAAGHTAWADDYTPFSADELDDMLAPIALYPDPLLAQMLPAASFIDQIDEAARYVGQYGTSADVDDQPWDVSVRAVAHYPDVLFMMDQKYDWTVSVGQAFVNQEDDVFDSIQRLRAEALAEGNLVSTPQQQVIDEDGIISIVPVEPEVIYVPQYDPTEVYFEPPAYGLITFGVGLPIGVWLNRDCDWHGHRIHYHGWQGGGWIGRFRPHIHDRRNLYINDRYSVIDVNRKVTRLDTGDYRKGIRVDAQKRHEHTRNAAAPPARAVHSQPGVSRNLQPAPARTDNSDVYRGRDVQTKKPASVSGYGGYGTSRDAETYRERGVTSRENMQQFNRTAPGISGGGSGGSAGRGSGGGRGGGGGSGGGGRGGGGGGFGGGGRR